MSSNIKNALESVLFYTFVVLYACLWHYTLRVLLIVLIWPYVAIIQHRCRRVQTQYDALRDALSGEAIANMEQLEEFSHRFSVTENTELYQYLVHQWYLYEDRVRRNVTDPLRDEYIDLDFRLYKLRKFFR